MRSAGGTVLYILPRDRHTADHLGGSDSVVRGQLFGQIPITASDCAVDDGPGVADFIARVPRACKITHRSY